MEFEFLSWVAKLQGSFRKNFGKEEKKVYNLTLWFPINEVWLIHSALALPGQNQMKSKAVDRNPDRFYGFRLDAAHD